VKSLNIDELRKIIHAWASILPCKVRIHLFGSYLKEKAGPHSDIDLAIEFLDRHPLELWGNQEKWQDYLSSKIGTSVHLEVCEGNESPNLKEYLSNCSIVIFDPDSSDELGNPDSPEEP
jgi:predicted nucleotidyltransferase